MSSPGDEEERKKAGVQKSQSPQIGADVITPMEAFQLSPYLPEVAIPSNRG